MDRPEIPPLTPGPVTPGRSALPAFLAPEAEIERTLERGRARAREVLEAGRAEARRVRRDGEERLQRVVIEAQEQAMRDAEDRARDRVSQARVSTQRWIESAEEAARAALDEALDLCLGD